MPHISRLFNSASVFGSDRAGCGEDWRPACIFGFRSPTLAEPTKGNAPFGASGQRCYRQRGVDNHRRRR